MSFLHKSVWVQFLITLYIAFYYISEIASLISTDQLNNQHFTNLLLTTTIVLIVLNIAVHTIVAIFNNKDEIELPADERDEMIALKGANAAYNFLSVWVAIIIVQLWISTIPGAYYYFDQLSAEFNILNMLLVGFLAAETIRFSTKIYHYHKGL